MSLCAFLLRNEKTLQIWGTAIPKVPSGNIKHSNSKYPILTVAISARGYDTILFSSN
jgi:hypothetical protein